MAKDMDTGMGGELGPMMQIAEWGWGKLGHSIVGFMLGAPLHTNT